MNDASVNITISKFVNNIFRGDKCLYSACPKLHGMYTRSSCQESDILHRNDLKWPWAVQAFVYLQGIIYTSMGYMHGVCTSCGHGKRKCLYTCVV